MHRISRRWGWFGRATDVMDGWIGSVVPGECEHGGEISDGWGQTCEVRVLVWLDVMVRCAVQHVGV